MQQSRACGFASYLWPRNQYALDGSFTWHWTMICMDSTSNSNRIQEVIWHFISVSFKMSYLHKQHATYPASKQSIWRLYMVFPPSSEAHWKNLYINGKNIPTKNKNEAHARTLGSDYPWSKPITKPLNFKDYKHILAYYMETHWIQGGVTDNTHNKFQLYDTLCTMTLPPLAGKQSCPTTVPCH